MTQAKTIFVLGGTGAQGGAVIDAALAAGLHVRALTRDPNSSSAAQLARRGVALIQGNFDDDDALAKGAAGADAVFSVQRPPMPSDVHAESRAAGKLIAAAKAANVAQFIHTSVARAGEHTAFVDWEKGRWWAPYWEEKAAANALVRAAGFTHWTILKPAYMMDNFIPPKFGAFFPGLAERGMIEHAMAADTRLDLIAAADVGRFAVAAIADPARFDGQEIALAAESLTMDEVAAAIAAATGKAVKAQAMSPKEAIALGNAPGMTDSQRWAIKEGYRVDCDKARGFGIIPESFAEWAMRHKDRFVVGG